MRNPLRGCGFLCWVPKVAPAEQPLGCGAEPLWGSMSLRQPGDASLHGWFLRRLWKLREAIFLLLDLALLNSIPRRIYGRPFRSVVVGSH